MSLPGPASVNVTFRVSTAQGGLTGTVEVPTAVVTPTQLLPILQKLTNALVNDAGRALAEEGKPISCREGCAACCRQMVPISPFEAEALADWIRSLPDTSRADLAARFRSALLALNERGTLGRLTEVLCSGEGLGSKSLAKDYFGAWVDCPFLIDERCGIHPIRPLACREYVVVSPPEYCADPFDESQKVQGVLLAVQPSAAMSRLAAESSGQAHGAIPLVLLFEWMAQDQRPGQHLSGPGPQVFERMVAALSD